MNLQMAGIIALGLALSAHASWPLGLVEQQTSPDELQRMLDRGDKVLVIDVRTDEEVQSGSIPGAIHIPMDQLEARMKDIPRDVQLVFT